MTETTVKKVGRDVFYDDDLIPDSNNRLTCLNCTKAKCNGNCEKISRQKGRIKNETKYAR